MVEHNLQARSAQPSSVIGFLADFAGRGFSARLLLYIFLSSLLDLVGIAVIFPYLRLVTDADSLQRLLVLWPSALLFTRAQVLVGIGIGLILLYLLKSFMQVLLLRYQNKKLAELMSSLTDDAVNKLLHARYALFLRIPGSDIGATVFTSPIHASLSFRALLQMANEMMFICMLFTTFIIASPMATMIVVVALVTVGVALYQKVIRNTARLGRRQSDAEKARYRLLFSMINAIRDIKVMGLAGLFESFSKEVTASFEEVSWRYNFNHSLPLVAIEVTVLVGVVSTMMAITLLDVDIVRALPVIGLIGVATVRLVPAAE